MNGENDYLHLNLANEWPTFQLSETLEIAPDGALRLKRLADNTFESRGVFRGGPFEVSSFPTQWYRLQVFADELPGGSHVQFFTFTGQDDDAPYDPGGEQPFSDFGWQAAPRDLLDVLLPNPPERRLWIGGVMRCDGASSPALRQMRVDYGRDTYLKYLPAIYGNRETQRDFIERFLSLHESALDGVEQKIDDLPRLFDPFAAPAGDFPSWLNWLAGWLAFDLNEAWSETETRQHLAGAFQLYGQRGTVEGLRRYLKIYAGVSTHIVEPGRHATLWTLGENSTLGFTTMLAPGHLQGAVVGVSATLDGSHVTRTEDFGAALFEDVAHSFCVQIYCADLTRPGALADARAVIEREKPAHTVAHVCVIESLMRIGVQARVGIDAIVAAGPPSARIGHALNLVTLAAEAEPCEAEIVTQAMEAPPCQEIEEEI